MSMTAPFRPSARGRDPATPTRFMGGKVCIMRIHGLGRQCGGGAKVARFGNPCESMRHAHALMAL